MMIIGCDFHTRYQQIAMLEEATGELTERRLHHQNGEAEAFYRNLQGPVRVGIEATGPIRWFERADPSTPPKRTPSFFRVPDPSVFEGSGFNCSTFDHHSKARPQNHFGQ